MMQSHGMPYQVAQEKAAGSGLGRAWAPCQQLLHGRPSRRPRQLNSILHAALRPARDVRVTRDLHQKASGRPPGGLAGRLHPSRQGACRRPSPAVCAGGPSGGLKKGRRVGGGEVRPPEGGCMCRMEAGMHGVTHDGMRLLRRLTRWERRCSWAWRLRTSALCCCCPSSTCSTRRAQPACATGLPDW